MTFGLACCAIENEKAPQSGAISVTARKPVGFKPLLLVVAAGRLPGIFCRAGTGRGVGLRATAHAGRSVGRFHVGARRHRRGLMMLGVLV